MPELPEVETIRIGLSRLLPGKKIAGVWHDWVKSFPNAAEDVEQFLIGAHIESVKRRAKVLLIDLDTKYSLVIHLKMTGQLVYVSKPELSVVSNPISVETDNRKQIMGNYHSMVERFGAGHPSDSLINELPDKSTRVILELEGQKTAEPTAGGRTSRKGVAKGDGTAKLFFNDQRKFGWIRLLPTAEVPNIDFMKRVGPEPLSAEFTQAEFRERLDKRANTSIKAALLDQSVIAGIGNIYADESLWAGRIHPGQLVKNISVQKKNTLFIQIRQVLQSAIEKGGSTDRNYINAEGMSGSYLDYAKVFRRGGLPCLRCGTLIIKLRFAGRGTHICPKCQVIKAP